MGKLKHGDLLTNGNKSEIQKAVARGKKTITISSVDFKLEPFDRKVFFTSGGVHQSRTERWIRVKHPRNLAPIAVIERVKGCNLRSKAA